MRRKLIAIAALAAMLALTAAGQASEPPTEMTTQVSIRFDETIYFAEMETGGMNIDFGEPPLPMPMETTFIHADDSGHTLRVRDARVDAGSWIVSAKLTEFVSGNDRFEGWLQFYEPAEVTGLDPNLINDPPYEDPSHENLSYVRVDMVDKKFVEAEPGLSQGDYDLTFTADNTRLRINPAEAPGIKALAYTSTITWTLTLAPIP